MKEGHTTIAQTERDITFTRIFNAPRELVFEAFSKPEHVSQWWGPEGWKVAVCTIDFRPGGVWHYCLRDENEQEHWAKAVYRDIVEPERIVYVDGSSDAEGNEIEGLPRSLTTITFTDVDGRTQLTVQMQYASGVDLETVVARGMVRGFQQTLISLEWVLAGLKSQRGDV